MNEGNNAENVDIINIEKLKNALNHYDENIHNYWKNYYETQKNRDEIQKIYNLINHFKNIVLLLNGYFLYKIIL